MISFSLERLSCSSCAFKREALRKSLGVRTVIVNHVVLLHPLELLLTRGIQLLRQPAGTLGGGGGGVEVSVGSGERSLTPVCLDESSSGCPVICVPKARVYSHWLLLWEWDTF
ncbi:hypothetical protein PanWU01x14_184340 [Parasponia andersonii]|uniref:Uncharacterized protein n=1 Tax=Parasponia andersonii TaxID=3476 RepID=A0A2P5C4I8_PARAD|nr:hypothetical protein PanWU01x14_184340 [Parasponia andersonii]